MIKFIVGLVTFLLVGAAAVLFVYPFVFTTVHGLFENSDLGTVFGLLAVVIITGPLVWVVVVAVFLTTLITGVLEDRRDFERDLKRRNEKYPR